ncbi:MAG: hypothetical protein VYD64_01960 [Pseudomonadota bacterium]|nr:hypothetical protein [Pseudomonadota bacterium]
MTRRQNRIFLISGIAFACAAAVTFYTLVSGSAAAGEYPIERQRLEWIFASFMFVSFACLMWFGLMPRIASCMFLRDFHGVKQDYKKNKRAIQKVLLITDDPRVQSEMNGTISEESRDWK